MLSALAYTFRPWNWIHDGAVVAHEIPLRTQNCMQQYEYFPVVIVVFARNCQTLDFYSVEHAFDASHANHHRCQLSTNGMRVLCGKHLPSHRRSSHICAMETISTEQQCSARRSRQAWRANATAAAAAAPALYSAKIISFRFSWLALLLKSGRIFSLLGAHKAKPEPSRKTQQTSEPTQQLKKQLYTRNIKPREKRKAIQVKFEHEKYERNISQQN